MSRRALPLLLSTLLTVLLLVGAMVARVPYVALGPGPTFNTLGEDNGTPVIDIEGREVFRDAGHLDLTTVGVRAQLSLAEALLGWVQRDEAVVPRELVFPPGQTDEQIDATNARQMTQSQDAATTAALGQLGIPVEVAVGEVSPGSPATGVLQVGDVLLAVDGTPVAGPAQLRERISDRPVGATVRLDYRRGTEQAEVVLPTVAAGPDDAAEQRRAVIGIGTAVHYPFTVKIALKDVGGPSAGLMFALGIVDRLVPGPLTGGAYVAGTGEITPDGEVRPIGGIQQKLLGARDKGATVFLVPEENCADAAANRPDGLQLVEVGTLDEAVRALDVLRDGGTPPTCS